MKPILKTLLAVTGIALAHATFGQNSANTNAPAPSARTQASIEELEAKFKATLTNATFIGRWCSVKDGQMGAEKEDKYTIQGAAKISGDNWLIFARIQYGQRDFVAPVPVQVKWAGDTPVITVDNLAMPGGTNRYTARVLVYDQTYAGRWSGGDHGGLLNGVISNKKE